ncbi:MAG: hypothetical protein QOK15_115 [Nocardioidaceae bacterium]|jgi:alkylation response protein AidB-like acyl-CoA dehydrogenase|nr:hypothetical protein [Nocardioidaceae bacterium]
MSDEVDLLYSDVEDSLRGTLRDLLTVRCTPDRVIATYDTDGVVDQPLWTSLAQELGLAGLLVPEDLGGAGASPREAAVVLEELGRFVAPVPFFTSAVVATAALVTSGAGEAVTALASGERTVGLVVPFSTSAFDVPLSVRADGDSLDGRVTTVAGAIDADLLLVPARTGGGVELHLVDAKAVEIDPVVSLDMTRPLADVTLDGVGSTVVVAAEEGEAVLRSALTLGAALLASEQVGVAQWCLDATVAYLKERRQFGRVVGGFQALKHRLADLYTAVESARAAARYAAVTAAVDHPDREVAACLAQSFCADVAVRAAEECIQLHGGIGMTWEHPAHLYLKRAKTDQIALGLPAAHRARLAELIDLPLQ